ncbi:unnamed protein product [Phaeothamnion confervicola]
MVEVAHWNGDGASRLLTRLKRRMPPGSTGSETVGAKFHGREGNSPDRQLRSRMGKGVAARRQPGGWLRSSHP